MGHFYSQDGAPRYTVTGANGKERSSTIADARKNAWVPSVTEVLNLIDKPALTAWKVRQGILAALTLPRVEEESEETYLSRVMEDSKQQGMEAAAEGTRIHDACECHFKAKPYDGKYVPHVRAVVAELERLFPGVNDWIAEASFACPAGFGGKLDLHSPSIGVVVDFKGKDGDFSDGKKLAYDQHYQLAAYRHGLGFNGIAANIFISRTHPGIAVSHLWSREELDQGFEVFAASLALWKAMKKHDSSF
jgi:hypothetical protein